MDDAYYCMRSRVRRFDDEQMFTAGDIERISEEYRKLSAQIVDLGRRLRSVANSVVAPSRAGPDHVRTINL